MRLALRIAFLTAAAVVGATLLSPGLGVEVLGGLLVVSFVAGVIVSWIRVLASSKEIAQRYVEEQRRASDRGQP